MRTLQPVIWAKGTFLTPQHLQAQDRFVESILQFRLDALNFRPWGFRDLQINQEALASGTFAIHRAEGMFADGLPFDIPESDPAPPARAIAEFFGPGPGSLDVWLALPSFKENGLNVSMAARGLETRYLAEVETFRDENTNATERPVQIARKNLRLVVEGENRQGHSTLRIARVQKTEAANIPARSSLRAAAAGYSGQRLSDVHHAAFGREPLGAQRHAFGYAPAEEPEPGRVHRGRYRELLAALLH